MEIVKLGWVPWLVMPCNFKQPHPPLLLNVTFCLNPRRTQSHDRPRGRESSTLKYVLGSCLDEKSSP